MAFSDPQLHHQRRGGSLPHSLCLSQNHFNKLSRVLEMIHSGGGWVRVCGVQGTKRNKGPSNTQMLRRDVIRLAVINIYTDVRWSWPQKSTFLIKPSPEIMRRTTLFGPAECPRTIHGQYLLIFVWKLRGRNEECGLGKKPDALGNVDIIREGRFWDCLRCLRCPRAQQQTLMAFGRLKLAPAKRVRQLNRDAKATSRERRGRAFTTRAQ